MLPHKIIMHFCDDLFLSLQTVQTLMNCHLTACQSTCLQVPRMKRIRLKNSSGSTLFAKLKKIGAQMHFTGHYGKFFHKLLKGGGGGGLVPPFPLNFLQATF